MGRPMVHRLMAAGHSVRVLGRSAEVRTTLAAEGIQATGDLEAVAAESDAVVVCVFSDDQVREVCLDGPLVDLLPAGSTLVVHTTGSPRSVEMIAARTESRGIGVLDAPVSGGPHDIAAGQITMFVGGADETLATTRPLLDSYGSPVLHVGPLGSGQLVKLINNALFAAHIGLLSDAVRLGTQLGLDEGTLVGALTQGSSASRALTGVAGRGSVARFAEAVGEFVTKDTDVVHAVTEELGGDLGAIDAALAALAALMARNTPTTLDRTPITPTEEVHR